MAKSKAQKGANASAQGFFATLFQAGLYKPLQGRVVRQVSFVCFAIIAILIAMQIGQIELLSDLFPGAEYAFGMGLAAAGVWICYRLVNFPQFADFLIAVEAEMNKVSWPTWPELWKASLVVIFVIFSMALSLWIFDLVWAWLFWAIGIR